MGCRKPFERSDILDSVLYKTYISLYTFTQVWPVQRGVDSAQDRHAAVSGGHCAPDDRVGQVYGRIDRKSQGATIENVAYVQ